MICFITEKKFIDHFDNGKTIDFETFVKKSLVKKGSTLVPLISHIEKNKIKMKDIHFLFENIKNKHEYLKRFYKKSLELPENNDIEIKDEPMKTKMNNNQHSHYKSVIRNLHCMDILRNTKSGFNNVDTFMIMLENLYLKNIIDYKLLTPSAIFYMKKGRLGSVFSSFYFRASIMNPYLVYSLNKTLLKGTKIFTPTLGWTSYCYGFLECQEVIEYVGTDVISSVCRKTKNFSEKFYPEKKVTIYNCPSEQLIQKPDFKKYKNHFDVVFFSPPYFDLEMYPGSQQSTTTHKDYNDWLSCYWEKTIQLCQYVLQKNGKMCYIISDYGSHSANTKRNLVEDMNEITKKYFIHLKTQDMIDKNAYLKNHSENVEKIILFTKK